jgi:hypothetical protein
MRVTSRAPEKRFAQAKRLQLPLSHKSNIKFFDGSTRAAAR